MRRLIVSWAAVLMVIGFGAHAVPAQRVPQERESPPGQVMVVTINAKQARVLGLKRFLAMFELGRALRRRPTAFDGGAPGAVAVPDVIIIEEIRASNLEIFERLLRQRFSAKFEIGGDSGWSAALLYNRDTVSLLDVRTWPDVCTTPETPSDGRGSRDYPIAHFTEGATGLGFTVAGMHMAKSYRDSGQRDCFIRNIQMLRNQLSIEPGPVIIGGDFNRRPVLVHHECDPNETSQPQEWWLAMTQPSDGGRAYTDAIHATHKGRGRPIEHDWTHEQRAAHPICTGQDVAFRRTRIDYLFTAGTAIAAAHTDHPGWAGRDAGQRHPSNYKYSDHRFLWGRFVIGGPPRPAPPGVAPARRGDILLSWAPVDGVSEWVLYRARPGSQYTALRELPGETLSYVDTQTDHDVFYRYALAAVGAEGAQSRESKAALVRADARGPVVRRTNPGRGAAGVDPGIKIEVVFDEAVDPASVTADTVRVYLDDRIVRATVTQPSRRTLKLNPKKRLRAGRTYRVVVRGAMDSVGNRGPRYAWNFTTHRPAGRR